MNSILISLALMSPPSFNYSQSEKAVFVDFERASHALHGKGNGFEVVSEISFRQLEPGHMLFDLVDEPSAIVLDGIQVQANEIKTPDSATRLRALSVVSNPGIHYLTVRSRIQDRSLFKSETYFKMRDLRSRRFLEQYLPTNLEYDQYPISMSLNLPVGFEIQSNAETVTSTQSSGREKFVLEYAKESNCSSVFFHIFRKGMYGTLKTSFTTSTGRLIPITIYGKPSESLHTYADKALRTFAELERDYGEYSFSSLTIYARGSGGGMEYGGATESSLVSLDHEIFHQYFGRGVIPANGNSGFLDEALASWRDYGYQRSLSTAFKCDQVCAHSPYARKTDSASYKQGRRFFSYVDARMNGRLKVFLKAFYQRHVHQVVTIEQFRAELHEFSGLNFD